MIISPALPAFLLLPEVVATLPIAASPVLTKPVSPATQANPALPGRLSLLTRPAKGLATLFRRTPPPAPVPFPAPFAEGEVLMSVHGVEFFPQGSALIVRHNSIPGVGPPLRAQDVLQERDGVLYQVQVTDPGGTQKGVYHILPVGRVQDGRAIRAPRPTPSRALNGKVPVRLFYNFKDPQDRPLAGSSFAVTDETHLYGLDGITRLSPPQGTTVEKVVTTYKERGTERIRKTTTLFWFLVDKDGNLVNPPPLSRPRPSTFATLTSYGRALYVEALVKIRRNTIRVRLYLLEDGRILQWKDLQDVSRHPAFSHGQQFFYFHPSKKQWIEVGWYDAGLKKAVLSIAFDALVAAENSFQGESPK